MRVTGMTRDYPRAPQVSASKVIPAPLVLGALVVLTIFVFVFGTGTPIVTNPLEIGGPPYP